jgi:putative viral A-type inclusion protein
MKFLKFLLVLFLLLLITATGGVIFSNKIVYNMTKTKNSEFENLRYSIKDSEIIFDNFVLNGKDLGKGKAKISFVRSGFLGLNLKSALSNMKLEDVDLKKIYDTPDNQIDSFIEKIEIPANSEAIKKTTEEFVKETTKELENVSNGIDNFISTGIRENILNINKIKTDYGNITDLKSKAQKITELDKEIKPVTRMINTERQSIENSISKIETEKSLMLENISQELNKLEKIVSLNDIKNMNSYIFMDKGKNITQSLNKALKVVNLIKEIKGIPLLISSVDINNGTVKFSGLDGQNTVSGEIKLEDIPEKITVKSSKDTYDIIYREDKLTMHTSFDKKIVSVIEYLKDNILEGRVIKLVSRLTSENNNFQNINETVLSDEEKTLLTEKINTLQQTRYQEIMAKYDEQIKSIDNLITSVYDKKEKLNQIQREMVSLSTIINLPEAQSGTSAAGNTNTTSSNNNSGTQVNNSQLNNQQQGNSKNSVNDTAEKLKEIFGKKDNKK